MNSCFPRIRQHADAAVERNPGRAGSGRRLAGGLCVAAVVALGACTTTVTNPSNGVPDAVFVRGASTSSMNEIKAGQLAQDKASDPAVRAYAAQMIQDHTTANAQLATVLSNKGVSVSPAPDAEHVAAIARMSSLSGPAFDQAYLQQMVVDHQKTVALFQTEERTGGDADVRSFAAMTLPIVQMHLQMAQQMANRSAMR